MSVNPFYRLSPFIQEYIYAHRWDELRDIQIEACRAIFDTDTHLLLASGTASGKTEAAFLPALTLLEQKPAKSLGILYIGPLKALINDQFYRLEHLLEEAHIPLWHWHGDVSAQHKQKLLTAPLGVLQITPESLESVLINHQKHLVRLFSDLRFVIIDEVHVFMGTDRGGQILCQLERLEKYMWHLPRRIGLSATLGDYSQAQQWLRASTTRSVTVPTIRNTGQKLRLSLEHFTNPKEPNSTYIPHIFNRSRLPQGKCLLFANSRAETEEIIGSLQDMAKQKQMADIYHVHHGSVAAALRKSAEDAMRDPSRPAIAAATVTLELGIDIGQLERVIQLGSPFSVSGFLQRLGRSGRRGNASEMEIITTEDTSEYQWMADVLPWQLVQAIAIIQLYLEERWVDPVTLARYPLGLLYHQTMSVLGAAGQLSPAALAQRVLSLTAFSHITQSEYRELLLHLIELDHIQEMEDTNQLILGLAGAKIVNNFHFYAVFSERLEFAVQDGSMQVGSILTPPLPGERFSLAGRAWQVLEVDDQRRIVFVRKADSGSNISWSGSTGFIHERVIQKMKDVLLSNAQYPYLQPQAKERLNQGRDLARKLSLAKQNLIKIDINQYCVFPWLGSRGFRTLERLFKYGINQRISMQISGVKYPYYFIIKSTERQQDIVDSIAFCLDERIYREDLLASDEAPKVTKYDQYVPTSLLRKSFCLDHLAIDEVQMALKSWR